MYMYVYIKQTFILYVHDTEIKCKIQKYTALISSTIYPPGLGRSIPQIARIRFTFGEQPTSKR